MEIKPSQAAEQTERPVSQYKKYLRLIHREKKLTQKSLQISNIISSHDDYRLLRDRQGINEQLKILDQQINELIGETSVEIKRNGEGFNVKLRIMDFGKERGKSIKGPAHILLGGFGLMSKRLTKEEAYFFDEAEQANATCLMVAIEQIPPSHDNERLSGLPSAEVDARIIMEALKNKGINLSERSVALTGYSEGAKVATDCAGQIDKLQRMKLVEKLGLSKDQLYNLPENQLPKNVLRLCSAAGTISLSEAHLGANFAVGFLREVSWIALIEAMRRYKEEMNEEAGEIKEIDDWRGILRFTWKLIGLFKSKENSQKLISNIKEALGIIAPGEIVDEETMGQNLVKISRRAFGFGISLKELSIRERLLRLWNQLRKMEPRSDACNKLGENWNIYLLWPRNDTVFPWKKVLETIKKRPKNSEIKKPEYLKGAVKALFPKAGEIYFEVIGEKGPVTGAKEDIEKSHFVLHEKPKRVFRNARLEKDWNRKN